MSSVISVQGLTKIYKTPVREMGVKGVIKSLFARQYRTVLALDHISFSVEEGTSLGYLGPNGAGKTTTLKVLSGLLFPDDGQVQVLGFNPWEHKNAFKKQIGFVMGQKGQLWWDLPAQDSFPLLREMYEIPVRKYKSVLDELVERFAVADLLGVPVRNLSLGERMKMELIAALLHEPRVLFLDEPTIGLDVMAQHEIRALLKEYQRQRGVTLILASHYMRDVEALCERVILIHKGKILFDGMLDEIAKRYVPYKDLTFTLLEPVNRASFTIFGEIRSWDNNRVTLVVKQEQVSQAIQAVINRHSVVDISVREPTLEDVIHKAFSSFGYERENEQ